MGPTTWEEWLQSQDGQADPSLLSDAARAALFPLHKVEPVTRDLGDQGSRDNWTKVAGREVFKLGMIRQYHNVHDVDTRRVWLQNRVNVDVMKLIQPRLGGCESVQGNECFKKSSRNEVSSIDYVLETYLTKGFCIPHSISYTVWLTAWNDGHMGCQQLGVLDWRTITRYSESSDTADFVLKHLIGYFLHQGESSLDLLVMDCMNKTSIIHLDNPGFSTQIKGLNLASIHDEKGLELEICMSKIYHRKQLSFAKRS
eukprot:CAMPEP_0203787206 /NCGR_PEP_ID=MMETSP0100_2-20121128/2092_1 /ASSEMBLY_ACC=CAM_ASM_000210 /TAXON_ID=96639 /ORGANISM=" , Strain NY0313808BC1" /LENGTH=255 /DNA_ID=CAMNT_0050689671 /DNA_START=8 /DNA_END=775 /DNA_ORIENTATION=+